MQNGECAFAAVDEAEEEGDEEVPEPEPGA